MQHDSNLWSRFLLLKKEHENVDVSFHKKENDNVCSRKTFQMFKKQTKLSRDVVPGSPLSSVTVLHFDFVFKLSFCSLANGECQVRNEHTAFHLYPIHSKLPSAEKSVKLALSLCNCHILYSNIVGMSCCLLSKLIIVRSCSFRA